jgi:adenine-specific DNA-methyltransferase
MDRIAQKRAGSFYTPAQIVSSLVSWAIRGPEDRLLDPSCGDGRFIARHNNSVGIEQDLSAARCAAGHAPSAAVHHGEFFAWANSTKDRFDCAVGNPPFIRYQIFRGGVREKALSLCSKVGANFSGLTSSWAPFLVATASLLKPGGRMAFVVPAEIGHAPYAAPLLEFFANNFQRVQIVAFREKLFPNLSEDCWLLYAEGFTGRTEHFSFSALTRFTATSKPPRRFMSISVREWKEVWRHRLRPYLISSDARDLYREVTGHPKALRLGQIASVGIGYVSGANEFFHLRPSEADRWNIHRAWLHPTVRNGRSLPSRQLSARTVNDWYRNDEPILLLRLPKSSNLSPAVLRYLDTEQGKAAQKGYKCRTRVPWYSVPDVQVPDFFLSYMSSATPNLVFNAAGCTCTNSVHSLRVRDQSKVKHLLRTWDSNFVRLSCELEGHALGGGMLKVEPREAGQILLPPPALFPALVGPTIENAIRTMRNWRHYAARE